MTIRVLVVEDEQAIRDAVAELLRDEGYEVTTVADGLDALELLAGGIRPDLILLDWRMPRLNGDEFLRERRKLRGVLEIPVIIVSASMTGTTVASMKEGLPVIRKPFHIEELLELVAASTTHARDAPGAAAQ